ncbi:MAG: MFS transporter [Sneathiellaceae bacterium]
MAEGVETLHKPGGIAAEATGAGRTLQQYLDETPAWADGTPVAVTPMTRMQWLIWILAAFGKFFEGMVVFMGGVALPLLSVEFSLGGVEHGIAAAAALFGILVGATALGGLSDRFGRKRMFIVEQALFLAFLVAICFSPGFIWFAVCLFGMGLALGCDYPTAHLVISEAIPSHSRGRLVLSAFGFQAVGALFGVGIGYLILSALPAVEAWRWMYGAAVLPAALVLAGRFFVTESPYWLLSQGRLPEAQAQVQRLLKRRPPYPRTIRLRAGKVQQTDHRKGRGLSALFRTRKARGATILAAIPWFLQDLGTYGIGIFTPTILVGLVGQKRDHAMNIADIIHNDMLAARGAAIIDVLLIVGIVIAVLYADRIGRIRLQVFGFVGCGLGLFIAALSTYSSGTMEIVLVFLGFMIFNFMTNLGPNAQTYLIAGEVFPTKMRGLGAGFAASAGKIGAVSTAFLFPVLLVDLGTDLLLYLLVGASLLGALVTWVFRIETAGRNLDELDEELDSAYADRRAPA